MATLPASTRYYRRGLTKVYFLPTIVATNLTPTRPEITAGTDLSGEIADSSGWAVKANMIKTPDLVSRFTSQIPGSIEADDSSLTFYADQLGVDVRATLPQDQTGYIVWMDGGDVPTTGKLDTFPVRVSGVSKQRNLGDEAAKIDVMFAITKAPGENLTIPT